MPKQERSLAEQLLAKRLRNPYFPADDDNWLVAQIAAGALPDDLKLRDYREMLDIELIAPARAKIGEPIALDTRYTSRDAATNDPTAEAYISGHFAGDDPNPLEAATERNRGHHAG